MGNQPVSAIMTLDTTTASVPTSTVNSVTLLDNSTDMKQTNVTSKDAIQLQLASPPASSTSLSPSPSQDMAVHAKFIMSRHPCTATPMSGMIMSESCSYSTPQTRRPYSSFADGEFCIDESRQVASESSISLSTRESFLKRKTPGTPLQRPRSQTILRQRSQTISFSQQLLSEHSPQQDQHPGIRPANFSTGPDIDPEHNKDDIWDSSEDTKELAESNKRARNELRGTAGRKARTTMWSGQKPALRRDASASTLLNGLSLSGTDSQTIEPLIENQEEGENSHPNPGELNADENATAMAGTSAPKRTGARRAPLSDISLSAKEDLSPAITPGVRPLDPLMTRQPRKALKRPRLVIVSPFPTNSSYWNEYANDTFNYLLEIESRYDRYMYINLPSEFTSDRTTLISWIIEISYAYLNLQQSTVHAAVNLLDRYLTIRTPETVPTQKLQCIGLCALMIAGKLEENTFKFNTQDLHALCDLYTSEDIAKTELAMLVALKFEVLVASATGFADYFKRAVPHHPDVSMLVDFLCDFSLLSHEFLNCNTSQIAAAALWIASCAFGRDWNEDLAILTGYSRMDLTPCSVLFKNLLCSPTDTLDLEPSLGSRYPLEQTLATLYRVLQ
ncbi:G2/mitotic-specific cyclin-B3 [Haplosporangium sp. Z 11]|nr:G2/mitotic-specific cyclin-B3 [Haplosporangium sp. Z 11]